MRIEVLVDVKTTLFVTSMAKPPLPRFPADGQQREALFAITGLGVQGIAERRFAS